MSSLNKFDFTKPHNHKSSIISNNFKDYAFIRVWRKQMNRDTDSVITLHVFYLSDIGGKRY